MLFTTKNSMLKLLYRALWLSADFERTLHIRYPGAFETLKRNDDLLSDEELKKMVELLTEYSDFDDINRPPPAVIILT